MTKILKYFQNLETDDELKKPIEQIKEESQTRDPLENSKYFERLFNRYHEKQARRAQK